MICLQGSLAAGNAARVASINDAGPTWESGESQTAQVLVGEIA